MEICPTSGRPHIQGYIELREKMLWKAFADCLPPKTHLEIRRGTQAQAREYCMKDESCIKGTRWEYGEMYKQGARNDLKEIVDKVKDGKKLTEVVDGSEELFIKYHNGIKALINIKAKKRNTKPKVTILWGPSGCGKTSYATEKHPDYYVKDDTKWWNGYEQEDMILLDDYDDGWELKRADMLKLLDRYAMQGETKGGYVNINSPHIIITSNYEPKTWRLWDTALERRIDEVIDMNPIGRLT
jgi:hypothetical protein